MKGRIEQRTSDQADSRMRDGTLAITAVLLVAMYVIAGLLGHRVIAAVSLFIGLGFVIALLRRLAAVLTDQRDQDE